MSTSIAKPPSLLNFRSAFTAVSYHKNKGLINFTVKPGNFFIDVFLFCNGKHACPKILACFPIHDQTFAAIIKCMPLGIDTKTHIFHPAGTMLL